MKRFALAIMSFLCAGCSATYAWKEGAARPRLPGRSVYVAVPENGRFDKTVYEASGNQTADAIVAAIRPRVERVVRASSPEPAEDAVKKAKADGLAYVVYPTILHWEDRSTEWSSKPDRIEIRLEVVDVSSGAVVTSDSFTGKSKWATFGGDHPQDLLVAPLNDFMATLF